jgi:hypothetical protein
MACSRYQRDRPGPDAADMTLYTNTPHITRDERELAAAMRRDNEIWRARMEARDSIVSNSQVKRSRPNSAENQPAHESLSIFEDAYSIGSLS